MLEDVERRPTQIEAMGQWPTLAEREERRPRADVPGYDWDLARDVESDGMVEACLAYRMAWRIERPRSHQVDELAFLTTAIADELDNDVCARVGSRSEHDDIALGRAQLEHADLIEQTARIWLG